MTRATTSRRMGPVVLGIPHRTRCRMHTHVGSLGIGDKTRNREPLIIHAGLHSPPAHFQDHPKLILIQSKLEDNAVNDPRVRDARKKTECWGSGERAYRRAHGCFWGSLLGALRSFSGG
eukprot:2608885-Pyramimonas_sp.AAC.1